MYVFISDGWISIIFNVVFKNGLLLKCFVVLNLIKIGNNVNGVFVKIFIILVNLVNWLYIFINDLFEKNKFFVVKMLFNFINKLLVMMVGIIGIKIFESIFINCCNGFIFLVDCVLIFEVVDVFFLVNFFSLLNILLIVLDLIIIWYCFLVENVFLIIFILFSVFLFIKFLLFKINCSFVV